MSDRNTGLTKEIFEAYKYLKVYLKCVSHRPPLLWGKYTKINENKNLSYISYTVDSCYLEQNFRFLKHEKLCNVFHCLKLLAISSFFWSFEGWR